MSDQKPKTIVYQKADKAAVGVKHEERVQSRVAVNVPVFLKSKSQKGVAATLLDYSGSGGRLVCKTELAVDQIVDLSLAPNDPVFATAQIVRKALAKSEYGLRWISFPDESLLKGVLTKGRL